MKWEYNTVCFKGTYRSPEYIEREADEMLDQQGEGGWELVSTSNIGHPNDDYPKVLFFFKRPR